MFFFSQQHPLPHCPQLSIHERSPNSNLRPDFAAKKKNNVRPDPNGGTNKPINHSQNPKFQAQSQTSTSRSLTKLTKPTMAIETQTPKLKSTYSQLPNKIQKKKNLLNPPLPHMRE